MAKDLFVWCLYRGIFKLFGINVNRVTLKVFKTKYNKPIKTDFSQKT